MIGFQLEKYECYNCIVLKFRLSFFSIVFFFISKRERVITVKIERRDPLLKIFTSGIIYKIKQRTRDIEREREIEAICSESS